MFNERFSSIRDLCKIERVVGTVLVVPVFLIVCAMWPMLLLAVLVALFTSPQDGLVTVFGSVGGWMSGVSFTALSLGKLLEEDEMLRSGVAFLGVVLFVAGLMSSLGDTRPTPGVEPATWLFCGGFLLVATAICAVDQDTMD